MDIKSLDTLPVTPKILRLYVDELARLINRHREGDSYAMTWRRQRENSPKNPAFWRIILGLMKEMMVKALSKSLSICTRLAIALLVVLLFGWSQIVDEVVDFTEVSPPKVRPREPVEGRSPPKRFVPVHKIETGGCARSDSTSAPAI